MKSGLVTPSPNSLRTLGCISSGPIDLCVFRFRRWSQTWPSLTVGGTLLPQSLSCDPSTQEVWRERLPVKTEAKICGVPQPSPHLLLPVCQPCSSLGVHFLWPSFSGWRTCRSLSYCTAALAKFSSSLTLTFLTPSLRNQSASLHSSQDTWSCFRYLYISFLPLIWLAGLGSAMLVSYLPLLISYTWVSRALVLCGGCP